MTRKWFTLGSVFTSPVLFLINAPFGRFSPKSDSIFLVDGITSWIIMELVSPIAFLACFFSSPISYYRPNLPELATPQTLLAALFLIHYTNRALISPLRTPSRSKSHLIVPLCAIFFNIINGSLMGSFLSSPYARIFLNSSLTYERPSFYIGLALWAIGFAGNIAHDEILLDIRRKANAKGKGKEPQPTVDGKPGRVEEYYAIPQGLLYRFVSYPNYLCEWVEWLGFALAAAPFPVEFTFSTLVSLFSWETWVSIVQEPSHMFAPNLLPPYIFLLSEVLLMLPRAYKGHLWYKQKFGDRYPKERKAVVPFIL